MKKKILCLLLLVALLIGTTLAVYALERNSRGDFEADHADSDDYVIDEESYAYDDYVIDQESYAYDDYVIDQESHVYNDFEYLFAYDSDAYEMLIVHPDGTITLLGSIPFDENNTEQVNTLFKYVIMFDSLLCPDGKWILENVTLSDKANYEAINIITGSTTPIRCCDEFWNYRRVLTSGSRQIVGTGNVCYRQRHQWDLFCGTCNRHLSAGIPFYVEGGHSSWRPDGHGWEACTLCGFRRNVPLR